MNITEPNIDEYSYIVYVKVDKQINTKVITNSKGYTQEVSSDKIIFCALDKSGNGRNFSNTVLLSLLSEVIASLPNGGSICLKDLPYDNSLTLPSNISIVTKYNGTETFYPVAASGVTGPAGAAGTKFTVGTGVPGITGAEGDLYLNKTSGVLYKYISTVWTAQATLTVTA